MKVSNSPINAIGCDKFHSEDVGVNRALLYRQRYGAVNHAQREIRMLCLLPSDNEDVICGTGKLSLDKFSVETVRYSALSYVWGEPTETAPIIVGGHTFFVTINPKAALLAFARRVGGGPLVLWVDSICINQADDQEKSHQVEIMGEIYRNASQTIAWLGSEKDDSKSAIKNLKWLAKYCKVQHLERIDLKKFPKNEVEHSAIHSIVEPLDFGDNTNCSIPISPLQAFFDLPWWKRLWIIQEVSLATDVLLICGPHTVTMSEMNLVTRILVLRLKAVRFTIEFYDLAKTVVSCDHIINLYRVGVGDEFSMLMAMDTARRLGVECSSPRDYVYGMLGMANDAVAKTTEISYDKTTETVFIEVAKLFLKYYGPDILRYCYVEPEDRKEQAGNSAEDLTRLTNNCCENNDSLHSKTRAPMEFVHQDSRSFACFPSGTSDLPSWVPRWNRSGILIHQNAFFGQAEEIGSSASSGLIMTGSSLYSSDETTLVLSGVMIDKVSVEQQSAVRTEMSRLIISI